MGHQEVLMTTTGRSESRLFVRNSTGLVRSASAVDATIFNAVISAPIGSTLAWSIFFTLVAFPGADPVGVLILTGIINIPVLIMFALLGASMPRVGALNKSFGGGTVQNVIASAGAAHAAPNLGNMSATLPTLFSIQGFMMWNFWSVYMSGELKSASNRRRQLSIMFGALIFDVVLLVIGAVLLFHVAGYNFIYAVNVSPNKAYAIPSGPFYPFLAALSANIPVITVIILGCFLFWSLPSMIANTFMPIRSFFAWSFDRLMPEKLADVNERTHSPVMAIVVVNVIIAGLTIWSVYSNVFQLVLGLIVLAGCLGVVIVAAAAIALPLRRPDLYRASPANVKFLGIPVLFIVAPLSIAIFVALAVVSTQYPALVMNGNAANFWWIPAWFAGLIVAGALLYYVPRFIRARRGINVSFVYKELPPE
jgi:basic amino acid/polyamine antiporter, APA family